MDRNTIARHSRPCRIDRNCWERNCPPVMFGGIAFLPIWHRSGCQNFPHRLVAAKSRPTDNAFDLSNHAPLVIALVRPGARLIDSSPDRLAADRLFWDRLIPGVSLLLLTSRRTLLHLGGLTIRQDDPSFAQN